MAFGEPVLSEFYYQVGLTKQVDGAHVLNLVITGNAGTNEETGEVMSEEADQAFQQLIDFLHTSPDFEVTAATKRTADIRSVTPTE